MSRNKKAPIAILADHHRELDKFVDEIRDSQRSIVFPDTVRNGRSVDAFFWNGSPHPTCSENRRVAGWLVVDRNWRNISIPCGEGQSQ